jgi:N-methylhydantoinase B
MNTAIDPFLLNILGSSFISIAREMGISLLRAAYSSIVREAKDGSTALLDRKGKVVAQAEYIPIHMNSLSSAFEIFADTFDLEKLSPDEGFLTNDPYSGGQHLNDVILFTPIFFETELIGFSGSIAHHLDMGGGAPGPMASATEIFQEGIRIPPLKVNLSKDFHGGNIEKFFAANLRVPKKVIGDFYAQIAACRTGERRLKEMAEKYGKDLVKEAMNEIQNYSERLIRKEISKLPDGMYSGEDFIDSDSISKRRIKIDISAIIDGSEITIDLSKGNKQVKGPINSPVASTKSTVHVFLNGIWDTPIPVNEGSYRPVKFIIPEGTIFNPSFPAACRARMTSCYRLHSALTKTFSNICPQKIIACSDSTTNTVAFGLLEGKKYEMFIEIIGGGLGAAADSDGEDAIGQLLSNTGNIPVEAVENELSMFQLERYELIQDSGGGGQFRGGLGLRRVYRILKDNVILSTYSDRFEFAPWGLFGGEDGSKSNFLINRDGKKINLPANSNIKLQKGDLFIAETSGGGGYGSPKQRRIDLIIKDLEEGRISLQKAQKNYGVDTSKIESA